MSDCEKCDKTLSERKFLKVVFTMVGIDEWFDITGSIEIIEVCYSMPMSPKKEGGKKMLKTTVHLTFNIEDHTVESMQCLLHYRITVLT